MGPKSNTPIQEMPAYNGPVHVECIIMLNVMASATEADLGGLFENFQKETSTRTVLDYMGLQQPRTPVATHNAKAKIVVNLTAK